MARKLKTITIGDVTVSRMRSGGLLTTSKGKKLSSQQWMELIMLAAHQSTAKVRKKFYDRINNSIYISPGSIRHTLKEYADFIERKQGRKDINLSKTAAKNVAQKIRQQAPAMSVRIYSTLRKITPHDLKLEDNRLYMIVLAGAGSSGVAALKEKWREALEYKPFDLGISRESAFDTEEFINLAQGGHVVGIAGDLSERGKNIEEVTGESFGKAGKEQQALKKLARMFFDKIKDTPDIQEEFNINIKHEWDAEFLYQIDNTAKITGLTRTSRYKTHKLNIVMALEVDVVNVGRGGDFKKLREWFEVEFLKTLDNDPSFKKVALDALENLSAVNLTALEVELLNLENAWLEVDSLSKKYKKKLKRLKEYNRKIKAEMGGVPPAVKFPPNQNKNFASVKNYINANMHRILRNKVMGKGNAKEKLNYRTGRFAKSAKVIHMRSLTGKTVEAVVDWMHFPYDTFAPGGRLHKPLRDPRVLIHGAVREAFRELAIDKLRLKTRRY